MLGIAWQYLTGNAAAAHVTNRQEPEWPPHPDRVFQALVASWGDRGEAADERAALEWIEQLGEPEVAAPLADTAQPAGARKVYVPVNDKLADTLDRIRKERFFPSTLVGDDICALRWPDTHAGTHHDALEKLARGVTRVGHSTSLVRMWIESDPPPARWIPARAGRFADVQLRVAEPGRLASLVRDYDGGGEKWRRPRPGAWCPYRLNDPGEATASHHAGRMLILRRVAGARPGLAQSLAMSAALRSVLLRGTRSETLRELVSGHASNGAPLQRPHAAYVPLASVGTPQADGGLLGLGIVLPRDATFEEEEGIFQVLIESLPPDTATLEFALLEGESTSFCLEDRSAPPAALRASTWSRSSKVWATVTPIVLDRLPPRRHPDREGFARAQVVRACEQVDLPHPVELRLNDAPLVTGSPHAAAFPSLPTKAGLRRRHVHAWLRFGTPVRGPLLIGAGRYRGYGLCRPLDDEAGL